MKDRVVTIDKDWWKKERPSIKDNSASIRRTPIKSKFPLLTVKEVARRWNVGIWSVYDYIASGELESVVVGRRKRISEEAMEDYLIRQTQNSG